MVRSLEEIIKAAGISEHDKSSVKLASKYYRSMVMDMNNSSENGIPFGKIPHIPSETGSPSAKPLPCETITMERTGKSLYSMMSTASASVAIDHYISKLANISKIDTRVERLAIDIAHKTNNNLLADGKAPNGLAAAYIYLASSITGC